MLNWMIMQEYSHFYTCLIFLYFIHKIIQYTKTFLSKFLWLSLKKSNEKISQFSKSVCCPKSSILQLIFAGGLFALFCFLEIIQVAESVFSAIFLLLLFLNNFKLADIHMLSLWPAGLCGFSTAHINRILGRGTYLTWFWLGQVLFWCNI